jgi:thymidine phosphorylase
MCRGIDVLSARRIAEDALDSGRALAKAREWFSSQGGDMDIPLPKAEFSRDVICGESGYISHMNAEMIGRSSALLGAGRMKKDDALDLSAGIILRAKTGDFVKAGGVIATLYTSCKEKLDMAEKTFLSAVEFSDEKPRKALLILDIVR